MNRDPSLCVIKLPRWVAIGKSQEHNERGAWVSQVMFSLGMFSLAYDQKECFDLARDISTLSRMAKADFAWAIPVQIPLR